MKKIDEYFVPWLKGQKMYVSSHIDLAWKRPELHRLMSNENPLPPSDKVTEAILTYGKMVSGPMVYKDKELLYDADGILKAITPKTKAIVIANPNNPTGNFMAAADFVRIAETGIPFVVDEAYIEYSGLGKPQTNMVKKHKNVIVTRTLSKAYGLGGLRFGYALGDS